MRTINMHEAKTHLSRLVERAARGESFVIARAGKPLVRVVPYDAPATGAERRLGFLRNLEVPPDFDTMFAGEIAHLFAADPGESP